MLHIGPILLINTPRTRIPHPHIHIPLRILPIIRTLLLPTRTHTDSALNTLSRIIDLTLPSTLLETELGHLEARGMILRPEHDDDECECCDCAEEDALDFRVVRDIFAVDGRSKVSTTGYAKRREKNEDGKG